MLRDEKRTSPAANVAASNARHPQGDRLERGQDPAYWSSCWCWRSTLGAGPAHARLSGPLWHTGAQRHEKDRSQRTDALGHRRAGHLSLPHRRGLPRRAAEPAPLRAVLGHEQDRTGGPYLEAPVHRANADLGGMPGHPHDDQATRARPHADGLPRLRATLPSRTPTATSTGSWSWPTSNRSR